MRAAALPLLGSFVLAAGLRLALWPRSVLDCSCCHSKRRKRISTSHGAVGEPGAACACVPKGHGNAAQRLARWRIAGPATMHLVGQSDSVAHAWSGRLISTMPCCFPCPAGEAGLELVENMDKARKTLRLE